MVVGGTNLSSDHIDTAKAREGAAATKKPYKAPSFRLEKVFEVSALACGKVFSSEGLCRFSRKAS
jgi:hypothetical protein